MPVPTIKRAMSDSEDNSQDNGNNFNRSEFGAEPGRNASPGKHESMILVQVNAGETFTIQAEDQTKCITGPAQVPMVSPNGLIPPIQVPHGYISHVIEDHHGFRKVVVIPEASPQFQAGLGTQSMLPQQPHGVAHSMSWQPGPPPLNYMHQMSQIPLNRQSAMTYPATGEHLAVFNSPTILSPLDGSAAADIIQRVPTSQQYKPQPVYVDMDSGRNGKVKERLQRKFREKHQMNPASNQIPSSTSLSSVSPSSSFSSYTLTPSPNSSPDSSPRIIPISLPLSKHPNEYLPKNRTHPMPSPMKLAEAELSQPSDYMTNMEVPKGDTSSPATLSTSGETSGVGMARSTRPRQTLAICQQYSASSGCATFFNPAVAQEPFPKEDGNWTVADYLSCVTKPEVCEVQPRNIGLKWSLKYLAPESSNISKQSIMFEIHLMRKGKDGNKFKLVKRECNTFTEIRDLKPGVEYNIKVLAELSDVKGTFSEITKFRTKSCQPDTPGAPKMSQCTKNSIALRWNAPNDNGEKITEYHLEWDEGEKGSGFRILFHDKQKNCFYKVNKLKPSHNYTFRLNCRNGIGESPWSPEVTYRTSGTAPAVPDAPRLGKALVRSLIITWSRPLSSNSDSGCSMRFTLEMDDGMGYGFKAVYYGPELRTHVKDLTRSTSYKFRLRAHNNEGKSDYSAVATFLTVPDKPGPPGKVVLKGKAHPTWFKVAWDPPQENGGSEITKYILECSHEKNKPMEEVYSGTDMAFILGNVHPGQECCLRVYCISNGGTSAPSEPSYIKTLPVVPGQCAPPRAASRPKPTSLFLQWDPPNYNGGSDLQKYELAIESGKDAEEETLLKIIYLGPALECSVGELLCGTAYKFFVRAANNVGAGQWSDPVEIETSPGPPEKPDAPDPETVTACSILLAWKEPHGNGSEIDSFSVEWGKEDSAMSIQSMGSVMSFNFQHLSPNSTYFFRVQAHNVAGSSPFSDIATARTMAAQPDCIFKVWQSDILPLADFIEELGMEDDEVDENNFPKPATSAMICWTPPAPNGSEIHGYILEVTPVTKKKRMPIYEGEPLLVDSHGDDSCHLLQNLSPDSEYRVRVKAVNAIGSGAFSSVITIKTQPLPPEPPVIECTCSYNSLKLKWDGLDENNLYLLQMKEKHGRFATVYSGFGRSYKVNRLTERTMYHFRINARNDAGEGPFSNIFCFTTSAAPPAQLKNPLSISVSDDYADISWDESENSKSNADTVSYLLNVESCDHPPMKQLISLRESKCRISPLARGCKYRVQVAVVRHVNIEVLSKSQDVDESEDGVFSSAKCPEMEVENHGQEDIVGQFSNWYTFECPILQPTREDSSSKSATGNSEVSTVTVANTLDTIWAFLSHETRAPFLLTLTFFVLAVFAASIVQIFRV